MMIEMPVTATKTYNQIISDDPSIEAGLLYAGYPSTTVQGIRDWFGTRNVCDDDNFKNFFLRLANPLAPKYLAQLRMETIDKNFDPLVENYLERYTENGGNDTKKPAGFTVEEKPVEYIKYSKPADIEKGGHPAYAKKIEETVPEVTTDITPIGYQDEYVPKARYTKTGTIKRRDAFYEDEVLSDNDVKGASKINPMSISDIGDDGTGSTGNIEKGIDDLKWNTASSQEQATTTGSSKTYHKPGDQSATEDSEYNLEDFNDYSEGGDENNAAETQSDITTRTYTEGATEKTQVTQGNNAGTKEVKEYENSTENTTYGNSEAELTVGYEKYVINSSTDKGTKETTYNNDEKTTYGKTYKERYTGRAGLTPQQALTEAITYLRTISPAFFDLMMKLEPAFLGVYDL